MLSPFRFLFIKKSFPAKEFRLLDIGSGNGSAALTKKYFPHCRYYGLDITKEYGYTELDFELMEQFYLLDLTTLQYDSIPDQYFDYIQMSHVIEHLPNGNEVLVGLSAKLKPGGFFYIEYPGRRSAKLPSMRGTLNFYDDPTHVRIYSVEELTKTLKPAGFTILKAGTRRYWLNIIAMPYFIIKNLVKHGRLSAYIFWDITGFAEYIWCRKNAG